MRIGHRPGLKRAEDFGSESKRAEGIQNCAKKRFMLMDGEPEQFNRSRNLIIDFFSNEFKLYNFIFYWLYSGIN